MSLRDQILACNTRTREAVEVPKWNCTVYVASMSGTDRNSLEKLSADSEGENGYLTNFRARLLVRTLEDENGNRLFSDGDELELGKQAYQVLDPLYKIAMRINNFSPTAVEEATKNLETVPADSSTST